MESRDQRSLTGIARLKFLFTKAAEGFSNDSASRLAAAFSFYAILSLAPLLVLGVAIAGSMLGDAAVKESLLTEARRSLGAPSAEFISTLVDRTIERGSFWPSVISVLISLYGASNLFAQLEDVVNTMWCVRSKTHFIKSFLISRVGAVAMVVIFGLVLLGWLALDSWLGWLAGRAPQFLGWRYVSLLASALFLTIVFAGALRALPRQMVRFEDVWLPAIVTAVGFSITKFLLGFYFTVSWVAAGYGSAGAIVVILLWVYYTSQIFFFGYELTFVYAHYFGSQVDRQIPPR